MLATDITYSIKQALCNLEKTKIWREKMVESACHNTVHKKAIVFNTFRNNKEWNRQVEENNM